MLERLAILSFDDAATPGSRDVLTLRRAWPRADDHLLLEYVDEHGGIVPGQWMQDGAALRRVAKQTARHCPDAPPTITPANGEEVLLQPNGADRRLTGLHGLLGDPGATLLSHRPERRAVVRRRRDGEERYAKVVRPSRVDAIVKSLRYLSEAGGRPFAIPDLVEVSADEGVAWLSRLPGTSLYDRFGRDAGIDEIGSVGSAVRWLHEAPPPPGAPVHDAEAEDRLLATSLGRLERLRPDTAAPVRRRAEAVRARLADDASPNVVIHRDLYDRQIFVQPGGDVGLLDFDTLALGEAALDVANMLAHLELRTLQGVCAPGTSTAAAAAFLAGYAPSSDVRRRVPAYLDAARLRLACLYAFRPRWQGLTTMLLARIGTRPGATAVGPR